MNYLTDFLNREKNKIPNAENLLNLLNPENDEKELQTPDSKNLLNLLNPPREYSDTPPIPPADGLQRRGAFIMPTRESLPAYRAHFAAKSGYANAQPSPNGEPDRQAQRIRELAATVTAAELLRSTRTIKPALQKSLSKTDLHELALTLADADKRENRLRRDVYRPARTFYPRDVYQPEKQAKESNYS